MARSRSQQVHIRCRHSHDPTLRLHCYDRVDYRARTDQFENAT